MKNIINLITGLFLLIIISSTSPAHAIFINQETVFLPISKTIVESYVATGKYLKIDGNIDGDLVCAGQDVEINGNISGDVLCAGQTIRINGTVFGNVRAVGQYIEINGSVARNTSIAGQRININDRSKLGGELFFGGESVTLNGQVGKKVWGAANNVNVFGAFNNDINIHAKTFNKDSSAVVLGKVYFAKIVEPKNRTDANNFVGNTRTNNKTPAIFGMIGSFLIGLLLIFIMRTNIEKSIKVMDEKKWASIGWGLGYLIIAPIILLSLIITIIGIPFAILLFIFWLLSFMLSYIYFAIYLGRKILTNYWKDKNDSLVWALIIGLLINGLLFMIPVIGGIYSSIVLMWGLGGMLLAYKNNNNKAKK